jgi:hypothetical protein
MSIVFRVIRSYVDGSHGTLDDVDALGGPYEVTR